MTDPSLPALPSHLRERARTVRLVVLDVDGVLTDGSLLYSNDGQIELKAFSVRDGAGIRQGIAAGLDFAIVSGRVSGAVERRASELGIRRVYLGYGDKLPVYTSLLTSLGIDATQTAAMGDDLLDLPILERAALSAAPADAHASVRGRVDLVTQAPGGRGAVRELIDGLLEARG